MINADMREYEFYTYGESNTYGQPQLSKTPQGTIKIAIYISSQSIQDNINYSSCNYIGLTNDAVNDKYVISFENRLLKVLYVNHKGRYTQVFLGDMQ